MRVLLVEDDENLSERLSERLRRAGFAVDLAHTRSQAEDWPDIDKMAAVILDLGLPDGDGMALLDHWRDRRIDTPVIVLTARGNWEDKVEGLNRGADDFVVKPVRFEELLARINAVMRRQHGARHPVIEAGALALDSVAGRAFLHQRPLALSRQEFRLLQLFMRRRGQVLSKADIYEHLYDLTAEREMNTIEVLVARLRRKIGRERIVTERGLGYRFEAA